jgi:PKD repeat protein
MLKILALAIASLTLALGAAEAQAVITEPIPADIASAPPQPIPSLPPAGETAPPAEAISDPITPGAACSSWYRQTSYGGRWPTGSAWWEFQCRFQDPHCTGICNANTSPDLYADFFYWDGSRPVFYGEFYGAYYWASYWGDGEVQEFWWDEPTTRWYQLPLSDPEANVWPTASFSVACSGASCSFDGSTSSDGDGSIVYYYWDFGDGYGTASAETISHTYAEPGTYTVTLFVDDGQGGWDSASTVVAIEASPPPPNAAPTASFGFSCSNQTCSFDGSGSADSDGTIEAHSWAFGDGTTASGETAQHTYAEAGSYTVTLTVTDNGGATATGSQVVTIEASPPPPTVISLTASGYKVKGLQKVDLSWNGAGGASYDVYRNAAKIVTVQASSYTDSLNSRGSASYTYKVCEAGTATCSNEVTVAF